MRDRNATIEALRRLAERPGTLSEGETAKRMLERFGAKLWEPIAFRASDFPAGTEIYYCYWCYKNERGVIRTKPPKYIQGRWWMLIKFEHLKQARWVPVESSLGCHIRKEPFQGDEAEVMYHMDTEWEAKFRDFMAKVQEGNKPETLMVTA